MTEKLLQNLNQKVDTIIRLLALQITQGKKQEEQIWLLSSIGYKPKEIARTLGTTPNTVRVTLSNLKKEKNKMASPKSRAIS